MSFKKFKNAIQPTIIKSTNNPDIKDELQKKYFVNYNYLRIDWFVSNVLLNEDNNLSLLEEDDEFNPTDDAIFSIELEESADILEAYDVPRMYFLLDPSIECFDFWVSNFVTSIIVNQELIKQGNEILIPGENYFVNEVLFAYLKAHGIFTDADEDKVLHNYLSDTGDVNEVYWEKLNSAESDYTNLDYYVRKNIAEDSEFTEDEIKNYSKTFCTIIKEDTEISAEKKVKINNQIYSEVMDYFINGKTNKTLQTLELFGQNNTSAKTKSCYCNTTQDKLSCQNIYKEAINQYLINMLGDTEFYRDWMSMQVVQGVDVPNSVLINKLISLSKAYIQYYNLVEKTIDSKCFCPEKSTNVDLYKSFVNYIQLLGFVNDNNINKNRNKIKMYGNDFGSNFINI